MGGLWNTLKDAKKDHIHTNSFVVIAIDLYSGSAEDLKTFLGFPRSRRTVKCHNVFN